MTTRSKFADTQVHVMCFSSVTLHQFIHYREEHFPALKMPQEKKGMPKRLWVYKCGS